MSERKNTSITFGLIRSVNPDINADNIEEIRRIDLSDRGIAEIDNLELFSQVEELILSKNSISKIENIRFLSRLHFLDLSFNNLTPDGLVSSVGEIPLALDSINLTGNPCAENDAALTVLQDRLPELKIIIDIVEGTELDEDDDEGDASGDQTNEASVGDVFAGFERLAEGAAPLDADAVLRHIVDRKCRLQSLAPSYNIALAIDDLNSDYERAVSDSQGKLDSRLRARPAPSRTPEEVSSSTQLRIDALRASQKQKQLEEQQKQQQKQGRQQGQLEGGEEESEEHRERSRFQEFMGRLRETSQARLAEIQNTHKRELQQQEQQQSSSLT